MTCSGTYGDDVYLPVPNYDNAYYECRKGHFHRLNYCSELYTFDGKNQRCVRRTDILCDETMGSFEYPDNPHLYVSCEDGYATVKSCEGDMIFDAYKHYCVKNTRCVTWMPDIPDSAPDMTPLTITVILYVSLAITISVLYLH